MMVKTGSSQGCRPVEIWSVMHGFQAETACRSLLAPGRTVSALQAYPQIVEFAGTVGDRYHGSDQTSDEAIGETCPGYFAGGCRVGEQPGYRIYTSSQILALLSAPGESPPIPVTGDQRRALFQ